MTPRYTVKIGTVFVLIAGLMFGCGSAIKELGLVFDNPVDAGRPSPSFNADIAPILTNRCAIAKCHVVDGPHDIDLRTYDSVIKGGDEGGYCYCRRCDGERNGRRDCGGQDAS